MTAASTDIEALTALRTKRLRRMLALCEAAHPVYRQRFVERGLGAGDIRTIEDLQRLPLTSKAEY